MTVERHRYWPQCESCAGCGRYDGEACRTCNGWGRDPNCCWECEEPAAGMDDEGHPLCEDCLFDWQQEEMEDTTDEHP